MTTLNAFHWRENRSAEPTKPVSPQLAYFHRKTALGTHPRQLRRKGVPVLSQADAVALSNKQIAKRHAVALSNKQRAKQ